MEQVLQQDNQIMIGIDIEPEAAQISWFGGRLAEPETVGMQVGVDKFKIPFCLFYREEKKDYQFGQAAVECNQNDEKGVFISYLYGYLLKDKEISIENEFISGLKLVQIFFDRLVHLVETIADVKDIYSICYTAREMDVQLITALTEASRIFSDRGIRLYFKPYEETYISYLFSGAPEFYARDSVLLYFRKGCLDIYHVMLNRKYKPYSVRLQKERIDGFEAFDEALFCSDEEKAQLDMHFLETLQKLFGKALLSSVFLTGDGFDKDWMKASLNFLCHGRRVFQGKNLFTKGACNFLMEESSGSRRYIFNGENRLLYKFRIPMWQEGNNKPYELYDGNGEWYEVRDSFNCLLDNCNEINIEITKTDEDSYKKIEKLELTELPERPSFATKLQVDIMMIGRDELKIRAKDLGLGEFYEATDKVWEKVIHLG